MNRFFYLIAGFCLCNSLVAQNSSTPQKGLMPPGTLSPLTGTSQPQKPKTQAQVVQNNSNANSGLGSLLDGNNIPKNTSVFVPNNPTQVGNPLPSLNGTTTSTTVVTKTQIIQEPLTSLVEPNKNNNTNNYQTALNQSNQQLAPLPNLSYNPSTSNKIGGVLTNSKIEPLNGYNAQLNPQTTVATQQLSMPPLTSIDMPKSNNQNNNQIPALAPLDAGKNALSYNNTYNQNATSLNMPALASIDGSYGSTNTNTKKLEAMPELAPIEGENNNNTAADVKMVMPELVPIDEGNKRVRIGNDGTYILKSVGIPQGTTIEGSFKRAVIIKPNIIVKPKPVDVNQSPEPTNYYKPHAGGGAGLDLFDEGDQQYYNNQQPQQNQQSQQYQQPQMKYQSSNQVLVQQTTTTTTTPCNHNNHMSYCPCCVKAPVKKWKPKKVWKPAPVREKIVYVYVKEPAPQPQPQQPQQYKVEERVVYVPQQPQPQQTYQKQPAPYQPQQQEQQVVYTDYTKTYYKDPVQNNNCQCPTMPATYQSVNEYNNGQKQPYIIQAPKQQAPQNQYQQQQATYKPQQQNANTQNYQPTNPQRYASSNGNPQGLNVGPTSGDYPVDGGYTTDDPLKYTFYVNRLGKYTVIIFNANFKLFLQQNGQVTQYEVLKADPNDKSKGKPKLNYFGYPEAIAGIPITYNYNRSINKIGNIKFDYDFEGFFKNVNGSSVFYNSRSSLSKVDNINIQYDPNGYVTGVDANNGLVEIPN